MLCGGGRLLHCVLLLVALRGLQFHCRSELDEKASQTEWLEVIQRASQQVATHVTLHYATAVGFQHCRPESSPGSRAEIEAISASVSANAAGAVASLSRPDLADATDTAPPRRIQVGRALLVTRQVLRLRGSTLNPCCSAQSRQSCDGDIACLAATDVTTGCNSSASLPWARDAYA